MFEDPAVMRIVEGRPNLKVMKMVYLLSKKLQLRGLASRQLVLILVCFAFKTLDSAIVDCGNTVCHEPFEEDASANF